MASAPYSKWTLRRNIDYYTYPWNYFVAGTGWPLWIGVMGQQSGNDILKGWQYDVFGASVRAGYMEGVPGHDDPAVLFPSAPWTTTTKEHFLNPAAPLNGVTLSTEYFDPPNHYAFIGSSLPITLDDMAWVDEFRVVLWARGTYGRYLYRGAGDYTVTYQKEIIRIGADPRRSASVAPIVGALLVLGMVASAGVASVPPPARRRRNP